MNASVGPIEPEAPLVSNKRETQVIAIYGKGGIGKSFTLANLSYMMAQQGKRVLLIGCDPKSDTTSLLFGGRACPTIIETSSRKKAAGEKVAIGDVCFKRDGVFAMELGGPEVGRGCGGRGIIHGFELLEKLGFHQWDFDYVLLDFLGDVVCGGFGLPIARDMCQKVIVVGSNDLQSLYVANNVCSAVEYFKRLGGNVGVAGLVVNKDDGTGEAQAFADAAGIPVLASIPADDDIRRKSASRLALGLGVRASGDAGGRGAAAAAHAADAGFAAGPVQGRCGRARCGAESGHDGRHVDRGGACPRLAGSDLRGGRIACPPRWKRRAGPAAMAAGRPCWTPRARPGKARRWRNMPRIIRAARMTSRNPCARLSDPCAWACACGARPRSCPAAPAAFMA
jgi:chlorophyllide a reductase subunit X